MRYSPIISILFALLILAGCSQVEITGRNQLNFVPDSLINSMSFQNYNDFLAQHRLSNDAANTAMVKRVGARIQKAVEDYCYEYCKEDKLADYQWEFNLVEDPNVNAWCMPGGKVVVYTGLLPVIQNEAGLAVVMGHEIAHAFAEHGGERMSQGLLANFGSIALSQAMKDYPDATKSLFMTAYGLGTQIGVMLPYSRLHEYEADHLGLIFMAMAGYDPEEAVVFWERMASMKNGSNNIELLSTHPSDANRIQKIKDLLPEAESYYKPQTN